MYRILTALPSLALASCIMIVDSGEKSSRPARLSVAEGMPPAGGKVLPLEVERHELSNGLEVLFLPMKSDGLVAYWTIVRTGSRDEVEPGVTGFAHFFEHMMFRGTKRFPEYDQLVIGMGANFNAFTTDDLTAYHLGITRDNLPLTIELEADRFQNLEYSEQQFKTEAGAVYGEYRNSLSNPFIVLYEATQNAAFDVHTYKHTTIGFEKDIQAMPDNFEYSKGFFKRFYRPENCVIVVAGDFDPAATLALIEKEYGSWKRGYQAPAVPTEPAQTAQRRIGVPFPGATLPTLAINFKGERYRPDDRTMVAGMLLGELAFGETSPLYKKLVIDEQRVESLMFDFGDNRDPGLWTVIARVRDPADVPAVEAEIWGAIDTLRRSPIAASRLDAARSRMKYSFLSGFGSPSEACRSLARTIALTGDVQAIEQQFATLAAVTPADVQRAANLYLIPEASTVALLHSKDQAPVVAAADAAVTAAGETAGGAPAEAPVLMPRESDQEVAVKLWFKVGSQDDPPGKEGLASLTAEMLSDGGTQKRSYEQILTALYPLAASYGSNIDKEMTVFTGTVHKDHAGAFLAIFSEALFEPGFRPEDFERLRENAISTIENGLRYASEEELGKATLYDAVFAGTRYAHPTVGTVESLKSIRLQDVVDFYAQWYMRDNVVLAVGGAYDAQFQERLTADLARLPSGKPAALAAPVPAPIEGRRVTLVEKPSGPTAISFGYPIDVHRGSREFYALWIANSWLGEHRNSVSHLYQVIREARGLNYGDYSYIEAFPGGGRRSMPPTGVGRRAQIFEVWVRTVPRERAVFALRAALRELDRLAANGLTQAQLDFQKKFLENYVLHFAETTGERLGYAVDDRYYGVDGHLARFRKMMGEITLDEVNSAIKKYMQTDDLQIAIVTQEAEQLKEQLVSGAPTPIDYGGATKAPEVLKEDEEIARFPLDIRAQDVTIVPVTQMFAAAKSAKP